VGLWATGYLDSNNNYYAPYEYRQILAHYYTGVNFQDNLKTPNDYRFNVVQFPNLGKTRIELDKDATSKTDFTLWLQNTGTQSWNLGQTGQDSCKFDTYNLALSYHIYNKDGTVPCKNYEMNSPPYRTNFCFERTRMLLCDASAGKQILPGERRGVSGITLSLPIGEYGLSLKDGECYILRWDIEVKHSHSITDVWLSRIHPDYTREPSLWPQPTALWPTQNIEICYNPSGNQPDGKIAPPTIEKGANEQGWHDKEITVDVAWKPPTSDTLPSGVSITGYKYEYTGNGGQVNIQSKGFQRLASEGSISDPRITTATFWFAENGEHKICLYSMANNGEVSENGRRTRDSEQFGCEVGSGAKFD